MVVSSLLSSVLAVALVTWTAKTLPGSQWGGGGSFDLIRSGTFSLEPMTPYWMTALSVGMSCFSSCVARGLQTAGALPKRSAILIIFQFC